MPYGWKEFNKMKILFELETFPVKLGSALFLAKYMFSLRWVLNQNCMAQANLIK